MSYLTVKWAIHYLLYQRETDLCTVLRCVEHISVHLPLFVYL